MAQSTPLRKGESVRVKPDVMCPDYRRLSLAGWQGRVFEVQQEGDGRAAIGIQRDSITLAGLPEDYLADCRENGCEGARGKRILEVIGEIDPDDERKLFSGWRAHLARLLAFPFGAKVFEPQERGPLDEGDEVQVLAFAG